MAKFLKGDLVQATKGDTVIQGRLSTDYQGLTIKDAGWGISSLEMDGFKIKVIERTVPTEPGVYQAGQYNETAVLHANGTWFYHGDGSLSWQMTEKDVKEFGPYTRLVPEE